MAFSPVVNSTFADPGSAARVLLSSHADQLRRLDFRFMLPSPVLKDVGYYPTRSCSELRAALACHAQPLVQIEPGIGTFHELVVIESPTIHQLQAALRHIGQRGSIYIELRQIPFFRSARTLQRVLQQHGFARIAIRWHWPNFSCPRLMVPFDSPALAHVWSRHTGWKAALAPLLQIGWWQSLVPCVSLLATR